MACVTLRDDIEKKFFEDFSKRQAGEFEKYIFFCTAYLTAQQKLKFAQHVVNTLRAELIDVRKHVAKTPSKYQSLII